MANDITNKNNQNNQLSCQRLIRSLQETINKVVNPYLDLDPAEQKKRNADAINKILNDMLDEILPADIKERIQVSYDLETGIFTAHFPKKYFEFFLIKL